MVPPRSPTAESDRARLSPTIRVTSRQAQMRYRAGGYIRASRSGGTRRV